MGLFGRSQNQKLLDAAWEGNVEAVRKALDKGADMYCTDTMVRQAGGGVVTSSAACRGRDETLTRAAVGRPSRHAVLAGDF